MKERGEEPTYASVAANSPKALINPSTGEAVGKKRVHAILEEHCYDDPDDPEDTWTNRARLTKKALTENAKRQRLDWAIDLKEERRRTKAQNKNVEAQAKRTFLGHVGGDRGAHARKSSRK